MCRAGPALRAEATAQAQRSCRAGPGTARQTQPIWPSIPLHDNDGSRLSCRHLVRHPASFLSPLMPPLPHHSILGRGCGSRRLLSVFVRHQPRHRPAQWLLHVHEDVSQHARTIVGRPVRLLGLRHRRMSHSSSRPSPCSSSPTYRHRPRSQSRANRLILETRAYKLLLSLYGKIMSLYNLHTFSQSL